MFYYLLRLRLLMALGVSPIKTSSYIAVASKAKFKDVPPVFGM
jgi:hypothetical protein